MQKKEINQKNSRKIKEELEDKGIGFAGQSFASMAGYESKASSKGREKNKFLSPISENKLAAKLPHIEDSLLPYSCSDLGYNVHDAIELCQKAYFNFSVLRNTIDIMVEFSNSPIHWRGGSEKSRSFFESWSKKINLWHVADQFFREYYCSGNIFLFSLVADLSKEALNQFTKVYGNVEIPIGYILLNPLDITVNGDLMFGQPSYFKLLNKYELEKLRKPQTKEQQEFFNKLDAETKKAIKNAKPNTQIALPLSNDKLNVVFYKKQDYYPLAIPMPFSILEDLNFKMELRKIDTVLARTVEHVILLVTMGDTEENGGVNYQNIMAMRELLKTESIGRVLVSDYTTKVQFIIPEISEILGQEKYKQVDKDIREGLMNMFLGEDKFANSMIKTKIFIERLQDGRQNFINQFLLPEVKKIAEKLNFKVYPEPFFEDIELKDELQFARIYTRLVEIGALTPEEGFEAMQTGVLPSKEDSLQHQQEFFENRQKGLYAPLLNNEMPLSYEQKQEQAELNTQRQLKIKQMSGRPPGTKTPQSTKNVNPIGASKELTEEELYSVKSLSDIIKLQNEIYERVLSAHKEKNKIKKITNKDKDFCVNIANLIFENEPVKEWSGKIKDYLNNPVKPNYKALNDIESLQQEHQISRTLAILLYRSTELKNDN